MSLPPQADEPLPYRMIHPGPAAPERITAVPVSVETFAVRAGGDGRSLQEIIAAEMRRLGFASGTGRFRPGPFTRVRFTTGGPARDGKAANYTFIRDIGAALCGDGVFTFGRHGETGEPFVHCHATITADALEGRQGGHVFPADCIPDAPLDLVLQGMTGARLVQQPDAETLHSAFEVIAEDPPGEPDGLFVRIRPNEDLVEALARAARSHGLSDAEILPSIGSLNAPRMTGAGGSRLAPGRLGMEIIRLSGRIAGGKPSVMMDVVDEAGRIHSGAAVAGLCPVCVTAEILLLAR